MMIDLIAVFLAVLVAFILVHYVREYYYLVSWLKTHAPMTWDTFKRLGLCKCNCTGDCRQGRDCPKR
jgi:hypothetical protein